MKIGFLVLGLGSAGGIERITTSMANALSEGRHGIVIIDIGDNSKCFYELNQKIEVFPLLPFNSRMRQHFLTKVIRLRKILTKHNLDILITVDSYLFILSFLATLGLKVKNIVWEHFNCLVTWNKASRTTIRKLCIKMADAVVPLTERDAYYFKKLGKNRGLIRPISNPNPFISPEASSMENREKIVLAVGRLSFEKGFDLLLKAWKKAIDQEMEWKLQIVGSGELEENLFQLSEGLGLKGLVEFVPNTNEIEQYYQKASFLVAPSRFEGFPLVLIEAKGFGLPCVSFDCETGPREIIEDGRDGFLVEPENVEKLSEQIVFLMRHTQVRKAFSTRALENSNKYKIQNIIKEWEHLFSVL